MNESSISGMEMSSASSESSSVAAGAPEQVPDTSEKPAAQPERAGIPNQTAPAATPAPTIPLPAPPVSATPAATQTPAQTPTASPTSNLTASQDTDLIEKEWVNKAKHIVERTRDDPYKQSEELTVVKADYIKKRYGKTIKVNQ